MKFSIQSTQLEKALYRVQGIADRKATMPILAHVLLDARNGEDLVVSATDLDVGLSGSYKAQIEQSGAIAIAAKHLYEIVKSLPETELNFELADNNWVHLTAKASKFKLVGMNAEEFPSLPSYHDLQTFQVPAAQLSQMIDRTLFCVSTDDNRHNLSGVYCESTKDKTLTMVATDGHRLALAEQSFDVDVPLSEGVIVPRKGFQELKRVLTDHSEEGTMVELGFSKNSGLLRTKDVELTTRLVEGQFPDCSQVIPTDPSKTAKISRSALTESLKRVSLLSQSKAWGVKLSFGDQNLTLVAEDPEFGEAREDLKIEYEGEPVTIGFNARYVLDVLHLIQDEGIVVELSDDLSPAVVKPLEEQGFLAVVMPMRI